MKHRHAVLATLLAAVATVTLVAQSPRTSEPDEIIHIDGTKNPELIPAWSAWGYAFRVFTGGPRQLPSSVLEHVSVTEAALIMTEAGTAEKMERVCRDQLGDLVAHRGEDTLAALDQKVWQLTLRCRQHTLDSRDRILARLSPEGQYSLSAFVESTKAGTSLSLPKKQLARFRQPE
jgi:hypothetical protein